MSSVRFNCSKKMIALLSVFTALSLVFCCFSASAVTSSDISDKQAEKAALEQKAQEIKKQIAALENDASKQEQLKAQLERQVENTESQVTLLSNEIAALNGNIDQLTREIAQKESELEETKALFKQRLRAMYMSGGDNDLLVLLGSDDVADYLARTELTRSVSAHDRALMQEIVDVMESISAAQEEIVADKQSKQSAQQELEQKQAELEDQVKQTTKTIENLGKATAALTEEQKAAEAAFSAAEDEIDAMLDELKNQEQAASSSSSKPSSGSSSGTSSGGSSGGSSSAYDFMWPTPKFHYISSPFGYRIHPITGVQKLHSGCDIAGSGINGTPVYAADSGTVSLATYNAGGYGYYVMLYHGAKSDGKQYATLYAHMTRYVVSAGQKIQKGDLIGYVGSTGASTGPHLHFEIRVNGTPVNPLLYF